MTRIAVENSLSQIKETLQNNGFEVVEVSEQSMQDCACCIISGQDQNVMGMSEKATEASVINAQGMTQQEILEQVNRCVSQTAAR